MKLLSGLLLLVMASTLNAAKALTINVQPTDTQFQVSLPGNPTTGYQWSLRSYDTSFLRLVSNQYNQPKTNLMGAGGAMVYVFEIIQGATKPNMTSLIFSYARPWEPQNATLQTVTVKFLDTPVTDQQQ